MASKGGSARLLGAALAAGILAGGAAHAATINGSDFTPGGNNAVIGGLTWVATGGGATYALKTMGSFTGVGISGGVTGDEIDINETLTGTSVTPFAITSITLGVLFDGPEFEDVNEVAQITIDLGPTTFTLTATGQTTAVLSDGSLGTVTNLSAADGTGGGAVWQITFNPALAPVTSVAFTALAGACAGDATGGACTNQSDFTLVQMTTTAVPAPAALAVFGLGLLGLGIARRQRPQA